MKTEKNALDKRRLFYWIKFSEPQGYIKPAHPVECAIDPVLFSIHFFAISASIFGAGTTFSTGLVVFR
jgi:hypothetical protein